MVDAGGGAAASPRKPWEGVQTAAGGSSPFGPRSDSSSTAAVVESARLASSTDTTTLANLNNGAVVSRPPMPLQVYGGPGHLANYNQYNNSIYTVNSPYGTSNNCNRGYEIGGGMYGSGYGLGHCYNGGMYGNNYRGSVYGGGTGIHMGGPGPPQIGSADPNSPFGGSFPWGLPSRWQSTLQKMHWTMIVFGDIVSLISENTHTFHVIMSALYMFLDRSGMLAGFVLKLLRMLSKRKSQSNALRFALPGQRNSSNLQIERLGGTWDSVWSNQSAH